MKKFLALVLALVMTMSLVTISAGAEDFTDDASITYEEAVDVMTAIGVVGGYADGSFNPKATLTRGAAAKIICNMILGPTTADALKTVEAPFSDVPADHVFSGYIAYCVSEGIVSGYTDGTFRPADTLTGYAFMKMLLGALGYDAVTEGYTGANFAVNVAKRALNIGLDKGLKGDFVGSKALTREEACLYAFNTLKATMVDYDNNSSITIGDVVISNSSKAEEIAVKDEAGSNYVNNNTLQFCEKFFSKLDYTSTDADAFGRPAHSWDYDNADVGTYVDTADVVFTAATKAEDVAVALKGYKFGSAKVVDDTTKTLGKIEKGDLTIAINKTIALQVANMTANGKLVELYFDKDNALYDCVVVEYTVDKVVKVTEKSDKTTYVFDVTDGNKVDYVNPDKTDDVKVYGEIAKGDIVTVATDLNSKLHVYTTESFTGAQKSYNTSKETIVVGGTTYTVGTGVKDAADSYVAMGDFTNSSLESNTYYVDQYGFVVKTTAASASSDFAYIVDTFGKLTTTIDGSTPAVQVRAVLEDGTVGVYTVELKKITTDGETKGDYVIKNLDITVFDKTVTPEAEAIAEEEEEPAVWTEADTKAAAAALLNGVYGYTLKGDVMTLENEFDALAEDSTSLLAYDSAKIAKNATSVVCADSKTALLTKETSIVVYDDETGAAKVYTGTSGLGTTELVDFQAVVTGSSASLGKASVVFVTVSDGIILAAEKYAYIDHTAVDADLNDDETDSYIYYGVDANGEEIKLVSEVALEESGLYEYTADGVVTAEDLLIGTATKVNTMVDSRYGKARAVVNGDMMNMNTKTTYYDISEANVYFVDADEVLDEVNDNLVFFVLALDNNVPTSIVETIYVYKD